MSKRSNNNDEGCGPGEIMRKGFRRKGFQRREFQRRDGTVVPASYVSAAVIPPTCVPDQGAPGRGEKTLPLLDNKIRLTKYGWSVHKPANERRAALRAASKDFSTLEVLQRLNLIRNYQPIPENKEIFSDDVEYMKKLYANIRRSRPTDPELLNIWERNRNRRSGSKQNRRKRGNRRSNQKGGANTELTSDTTVIDMGPTSETSDDVVNKVYLPETRAVEIQEKICGPNGKCEIKNVVYESHNINGKQIVFHTIDEKDTDDVLELDKKYYDSDQTKENVINKIITNRGRLIGIKVDGKLQGYCHYDIIGNHEVKIIWFCANKGYGRALYIFIEKYFKRNDYHKIIIIVSLEGTYALTRLNFWYHMGFIAYEDHIDQKKIYMYKEI